MKCKKGLSEYRKGMQEKYGVESVCYIGTYTEEGIKPGIKDVLRKEMVPYKDSLAFTAALPDDETDWDKMIAYLKTSSPQSYQLYLRYKEGLKDLPVKMNPYDENVSEPNFWLSCLLIDSDRICKHSRTHDSYTYEHEDGKTCPDEIFDALKANNIETRPIWKPMHMQPIYEGCDFIKNPNYSKPVSEDIFDRGICLPSDIKMDKDNQLKIIKIIKDLFN